MSKELLKDETLAEKLIKRWFWLYFFSFLIAPSGYIIKLLISNDLSVAEVWVIYSIIWFVALLSNYNDLWFTESLKYFLPKFWINKKYDEFKTSLFLALWIQTLTAILIAILLWFGADFLAQNYFHSPVASEILKVFSLFFVVFNIFRTLETIFDSFQDTFATKFVDFIRMWSIVLFCLILFFSYKWSVLFYSLAWFWWTLIGLLVSFLIFFKKYKHILEKWKINLNKNLTKQIFSYAIWVVIATQWAMILWSMDLQMIIYFLWPKQAWYYTNYLSLLSIYSIFLWPIFWFLFPVTTELIEKKQDWKLSLMLSIFYKYFVVFGWIFSIFFAVFWSVIAFILFWKKFVYSGQLLSVWAWMVFLSILVSINFSVLAWLWKIKQRVKIIWIAALINFVLNVVLILKIWIVWAIIATFVSTFVMFILSFLEIKKSNIKIDFDWKFYLKNIVGLIVAGVVFYYCLKFFSFKSRLYDLKLLLVFIFVYVLWLSVWNFKEIKLLKTQVENTLEK